MAGKSRGIRKGNTVEKGGEENVTPLPTSAPIPAPLPEARSIQLPEGLRWKVKAFQEVAEKAKAVVKATHTELLLRQAEVQQATRELQDVIEEMKAALESQIPEGYVLDQLNPVEGIAVCRRVPQEE